MNGDTIKEAIRQHFDCRDYLRRSSGCSLYICPACGSGSGRHKTGAVKYYPSTRSWHCHRCGTHGDIFTLYELEHGVDFRTALRELAAQLGTAVELPDTKPARDRSPAPPPARSAPPQPKDLSEYFTACRARLHAPAAVAYLTGRGISLVTAERCGLGYDPRADPAGSHCFCPRIIIPTNESRFVARSIDPRTHAAYRVMNNCASPGIFHERVLTAANTAPVFVTEGAFDALSILEVGGQAVALNSAANRKSLLDVLRTQPVRAPLLLCLDNDEAGWAATAALAERLSALCIPFRDVCADVCGSFKDPNEALCADRSGFSNTVREILKLYDTKEERT